ncbi:MAG: MBL fold metallo-hydrolase [Planctomycetes bacterium]|nr:MBL fold metallo-hydrolase [Planctomycetota bacterium]
MTFIRQLCAVTVVLFCFAVRHAHSENPELEVLVLFDNTSAREDLRRSWGFSALIDFRGHRVLFDAGSDPTLLLEHLEKMQIDPKSIDHAIISHQHGDHLRGVYWVFEKNPKMTVHFLDNFPEEAFRRAAGVGMKPRRVKGPFEVVPGIYSTGIVDGKPPEQSLVIDTSLGLVMLVGCSHPGVVKLVETAQSQRKTDSIHLLLGGFHMLRKQPNEIKAAITQLKDLNVTNAVPAHCSGDLAKELFQSAYGDKFNTAGAGRRIVLDEGKLVISTLEARNEPTDK